MLGVFLPASEHGAREPKRQGNGNLTVGALWMKIHVLKRWREKTASAPIENVPGMGPDAGRTLAASRRSEKLSRLDAQISLLTSEARR